MLKLADIVIVNESKVEATAGDVTIFRSVEAVCNYLEHWWVEDGEGFAFTATGERLKLGVDEQSKVVVVNREAAPDGETLVYNWLSTTAIAVLEARRFKAARGKVVLSQSEQEGQLPTSIEEIISYVGFTR